MSVYRFRERWSSPARRTPPVEVGERMAAWLLDAVQVLGPDLSWRALTDEARDEDDLVRRRVGLEGRGEGSALARATSELALSRSPPSGSGRIELLRVRPYASVLIDTHGGEQRWDVDAFGLSEASIVKLRDAHARALGPGAKIGGARRDPPEPRPARVARGDARELAQWLNDLAAIGADASVVQGELRLSSLRVDALDAAFEARVTLGEILAESGVDDWDDRATELLFAATRG